MVAQFARVRPLGLLQGFDLQRGAQAGQASREFVEVDGGAGPQPFQFDFGQASQQELSEADDMFDQGERRLGVSAMRIRWSYYFRAGSPRILVASCSRCGA